MDLDDLEEDEEIFIHAVEELLTDLLQLCHGTIRNVIARDPVVLPMTTASDDIDDHDDDDGGGGIGDDSVQRTVHTVNEMDPKAMVAMKKGPGLGQFMAVLATMQSTAEKVKEVGSNPLSPLLTSRT